MPSAVSSILIINPFGIGDVLFSTPVIRALRAAFPRARLSYLCNRRTEAVLRRNPHLDQLFVYEKDELDALWKSRPLAALGALGRLLIGIRRARVDLALDLSLVEQYSFILSLLGVRRRMGYAYRRRGRFLTRRMRIAGFDGRHVIEHHASLMAALGFKLDDRRMELSLTDEDRRRADARLREMGTPEGKPCVALMPAGGVSWGAEAQYRRWPQAHFAAAGREFARRGYAVLVLGEEADRTVCAAMTRAIGEGALDASGRTTLGEFVAILSRCRLVLANDGGPVHLAVTQSVPTVAIFGPVDPRVYGPYPPGPSRRAVHIQGLPCRPCYHRFRFPPCPYDRACLRELSVEDVLAACDEVMATTADRVTRNA
ncbi:MAG TPA: glycosyltransferase family 9 protein [bacterium]